MILLLGLFFFADANTAHQPAAVTKVLDLFDRLRAGKQTEFQLTEAEVNQYLAVALQRQPRPGLQSTQVKFFPDNYVTTFTVVDFDAVERWKPGTIPVLLRPMLTGRKTVWVDVRFRVNQGRLTFAVEKAYFGKVWLPAALVQELIAVVGARQPEHYDTSKPLLLPFGLRELSTASKFISGSNF